MEKRIYVIGHRNPDTDSVVSAAAYARLKNALGLSEFRAARAGKVNPQTEYIFDRFGPPVPEFLADLVPKVEYYLSDPVVTVDEGVPLWEALERMERDNLKVLPIVRGDGTYRSLLHYNAFARYILQKINPNKKSAIPTSIDLLLTTLRAQPVTAYGTAEVRKSFIVVAASADDSFRAHLEAELPENSLVIVGDRVDIQRYCIERKVRALVITNGVVLDKELVAHAIHRRSTRAARPFVEVNCAAIPDTLIESELFGHERGAFTDAIAGRKGRFELASGGTLFLDEIGDMSLSAQAKVLRAIQERKIERIGGERTIDVDVRIIAATNKNLEAECRAGRFREDLFFRLNVVPIVIPPLRDRTDDIPLLMERFLAIFGAESLVLEEDAIDFICRQEWPGNVRELKNLAERIAVMCDGDRIGEATLKSLLQRYTPDAPAAAKNGSSGADGLTDGLPAEYLGLDFASARDLFEKRYIERKLAENGYTISRTAEAVGLYPSNLHAKIRKHGIRTDR